MLIGTKSAKITSCIYWGSKFVDLAIMVAILCQVYHSSNECPEHDQAGHISAPSLFIDSFIEINFKVFRIFGVFIGQFATIASFCEVLVVTIVVVVNLHIVLNYFLELNCNWYFEYI